MNFPEGLSCPVPKTDYDTIQLAHGAGGRLTAELVEKFFLPRFDNPILQKLEDQAQLEFGGGRLAFTTDSFVVDPIFFPGGDIGELAVNGTVNDLAMSGAEPLWLSVGFILEEGLPLEELHRVLLSMEQAAKAAGVQIVTGDTKVVNKGTCDKLYINTSGIGRIPAGVELGAHRIRPGDKILLSGTIADHGMAVLTSRKGLAFETRVQSDTAALNDLVQTMLATGGAIKALRDPTRGGVAATLNEFAKAAGVGMRIEEETLPVRPEVKGACEVLGLDPLYVANEGKLVAVVAAQDAEQILTAMRQHPLGKEAVLLGEVVADHPGIVSLRTLLGVERIVDMPVGEQLPRIC